ncbi:cuticle protein 16.5 isoform X2 [Ixodes scapularis]
MIGFRACLLLGLVCSSFAGLLHGDLSHGVGLSGVGLSGVGYSGLGYSGLGYGYLGYNHGFGYGHAAGFGNGFGYSGLTGYTVAAPAVSRAVSTYHADPDIPTYHDAPAVATYHAAPVATYAAAPAVTRVSTFHAAPAVARYETYHAPAVATVAHAPVVASYQTYHAAPAVASFAHAAPVYGYGVGSLGYGVGHYGYGHGLGSYGLNYGYGLGTYGDYAALLRKKKSNEAVSNSEVPEPCKRRATYSGLSGRLRCAARRVNVDDVTETAETVSKGRFCCRVPGYLSCRVRFRFAMPSANRAPAINVVLYFCVSAT